MLYIRYNFNNYDKYLSKMSSKLTKCDYIYTKGRRKGEKCGRNCRVEREFKKCGEHRNCKTPEEITNGKLLFARGIAELLKRQPEDGKPKMTMENINKIWTLNTVDGFEDEEIFCDISLRRL